MSVYLNLKLISSKIDSNITHVQLFESCSVSLGDELNKAISIDVSIRNAKLLNLILEDLCIAMTDNLNQAVYCWVLNKQVAIEIEISQSCKMYSGKSAQSKSADVIVSCII